MTTRPPSVLAISGLDPSAGAGLLADVGVFRLLRCQPLGIASCLTAQSLRAFVAVEPLAPAAIERQLDTLFAAETPAAIKVGLVADVGAARTLARFLSRHPTIPVVVDPVLASSRAGFTAAPELVATLREVLLPACTVITPNLPELAQLASPGAAEQTARLLLGGATRAVLVKAGHGAPGASLTDLLVLADRAVRFTIPRTDGPKVHGTGCLVSAALAAFLALGRGIEAAARDAVALVARLRSNAVPGGDGDMARVPLFGA